MTEDQQTPQDGPPPEELTDSDLDKIAGGLGSPDALALGEAVGLGEAI
ncbi:MAG: hypothetical protein WCI74_02870 [Actinomycetes bacterium]